MMFDIVLPSVRRLFEFTLNSKPWSLCGKRNLAVKKKNVSKIKRPPAPFVAYYLEEQSIIRDKYNLKSLIEIVKKTATEWKLLSDNDRKKYLDKYKSDLRIYNQKCQKSGSEQLKLIKPKQPLSAFYRFYKDQNELRCKSKDRLKILSVMWGRLSPEKKEKYEIEYQADLKEFRKKMIKWQKGIIKNMTDSNCVKDKGS